MKIKHLVKLGKNKLNYYNIIMGSCNSNNKQSSKETNSMMITISQKLQGSLSLPIKEKQIYSKNHINNLEKSYIVKKINEIGGEQIIIENCNTTTFVILDFSSQVIIEKCKNCNFLIAPCKTLVYIKESENINVISASQQFKMKNVSKSKISLFCSTKPCFTDCDMINLGCFNYDYTGLNAELNIWENRWSEYTSEKSNIQFINTFNEFTSFKELKNALKEIEISVKEYLSIPFTNGMSFDYKNKSFLNCLVFVNSSVNTNDLLIFCDPVSLKGENSLLMKTSIIKRSYENLRNIVGSSEIVKDFFNGKDSVICLWIMSNKEESFTVVNNFLETKFSSNYLTLIEPISTTVKELIHNIFEFPLL